MAYLYRHIRHDTNEVFYVGVGNDKNYSRACDKYRRNTFWKRIIAKTSYTCEILIDDLSYDEVLKKEVEFIKLYGRKNISTGTLVNLTDGGRGAVGAKVSEQHKEKLSLLMLGNSRGKGVVFTIERVQKIREAALGNQHWVGKTHTPETRLKLKRNSLGNKHWLGRSHKESSKKKVSEARKKTILNFQTGIYYNGIDEAAQSIPISPHTLNVYLRNVHPNKTPLKYV